jgi:hypothetical protein
MNDAPTISLVTNRPDWARSLISSLPRTVHRANNSSGDIVLVDGVSPWADTLLSLVLDGRQRILLMDPCEDTPATILAIVDAATRKGAQIAISEIGADNPIVPMFRPWLDGGFATMTLQGWGIASPRAQILTHLRILRAIGVQALRLSDLRARPGAALAGVTGRLADESVLVRLAAVTTEATSPRFLLVAHSGQAAARLDILLGADAGASEATLTTRDTLVQLPTIYESAHRQVLRAFARGESGDSAGTLRAFASDCALLSAAFI